MWFIAQPRRLLSSSSSSSDLLRRKLIVITTPRGYSYSSSSSKADATSKQGRLLLSGPDASGIVASFSHLLFSRGCGIIDSISESSENDERVSADSSQHKRGRMFFQRVLFDYSNVCVERNVIEEEINGMCEKFGMESQLVRACCTNNSIFYWSNYNNNPFMQICISIFLHQVLGRQTAQNSNLGIKVWTLSLGAFVTSSKWRATVRYTCHCIESSKLATCGRDIQHTLPSLSYHDGKQARARATADIIDVWTQCWSHSFSKVRYRIGSHCMYNTAATHS